MMRSASFKAKKIIFLCTIYLLLTSGFLFGQNTAAIESEHAGKSGKPAALTSLSKNPVTINWMGHWKTEDLREVLVHEVARAYLFLHPDIKINLKFPQDIFGVRDKRVTSKCIVEMIRSGDIKWDIIHMDDYIYRFVAEELGNPEWGKEYLVDFEKVPGFVMTQKQFIITDPAYRNQTGGILVGPYIEGYYYTLWYNRDVAERLGIKIKERGMTFNDLLGYVQRVYAYNGSGGNEPIAAFYEAKNRFSNEILFQSLAKSEIKNFSEAKSDTTSRRKHAAFLKTLEAFETLGRFNPLLASHNRNIWFKTRHIVLEDRVLFLVGGTWMYSHFRGLDEKKMGKMVPVEMPVFQKVGHTLGGYLPTWAVMKNSPNRETAISLVMRWSCPAVAEKWVRYTKNPTGIRGNLSGATQGNNVYERFQAYMTEKYEERVHYSPDAGYILGRKNALLQSEINRKLRMLLTGRITAQQAYKKILRKCR